MHGRGLAHEKAFKKKKAGLVLLGIHYSVFCCSDLDTIVIELSN